MLFAGNLMLLSFYRYGGSSMPYCYKSLPNQAHYFRKVLLIFLVNRVQNSHPLSSDSTLLVCYKFRKVVCKSCWILLMLSRNELSLFLKVPLKSLLLLHICSELWHINTYLLLELSSTHFKFFYFFHQLFIAFYHFKY